MSRQKGRPVLGLSWIALTVALAALVGLVLKNTVGTQVRLLSATGMLSYLGVVLLFVVGLVIARYTRVTASGPVHYLCSAIVLKATWIGLAIALMPVPTYVVLAWEEMTGDGPPEFAPYATMGWFVLAGVPLLLAIGGSGRWLIPDGARQ